ncbi:MAG: hypothetical protein OSJ83_14155, partial [Clostridia bacterium]|nr:hypothetical protein [Clostridia bacterium]
SASTATDITVLRRATKNILYTVANSNAMNGNGEGIIWGYSIPTWVVWLIVATCSLVPVCGALCFFMVREIKKCKALSADNGGDGATAAADGQSEQNN